MYTDMSRLCRLLFKFISEKSLFSVILRFYLVGIEKVRFLLGPISDTTTNSLISVLFSGSSLTTCSSPIPIRAEHRFKPTWNKAKDCPLLISTLSFCRVLWSYVQSSSNPEYTSAGVCGKEVLPTNARLPNPAAIGGGWFKVVVLRFLGPCRIIEKNKVTIGGNQ